jgi:hypothetical protein
MNPKLLHWRDIDLAITHELDEFFKIHPKHPCELGPSCGGFGKNVLLPKLMDGSCGISVDSIPLNLIGLLYVDTPFWDRCSVVCANLDDEAGNKQFIF